ncbi:MAG: SDR family NAD(P)-dependent oxidoreductase [Rubrobacter sp.]|nr:SDR family NAD(P)-dependent oxidoreductase [Rubrobacter sp.]
MTLMVNKTLENRVAVVTGASSGIGDPAAKEIARRGAVVALAARDGEKLVGIAREIRRAGGIALPVQTDVTDDESVRNFISRTVSELGGVDVLVNNAGLGLSGRVGELRADDLRYVYEVNVLGPLRCIQAALPHMRVGGRIINVSSVVGLRAIPKGGGYCSSKFALNALSEALRVEIAERGITVTSVYPGTTRTAFRDNSRRTKDEKRGWRPKGVPPEKVATKIARAAERGGRDLHVSLQDLAFTTASALSPSLVDRALRSWTKD